MGLVTNKFKSGGLYEKHGEGQLGILGNISPFAYRHKETKKNLCQRGLSQDLPNTGF